MEPLSTVMPPTFMGGGGGVLSRLSEQPGAKSRTSIKMKNGSMNHFVALIAPIKSAVAIFAINSFGSGILFFQIFKTKRPYFPEDLLEIIQQSINYGYKNERKQSGQRQASYTAIARPL